MAGGKKTVVEDREDNRCDAQHLVACRQMERAWVGNLGPCAKAARQMLRFKRRGHSTLCDVVLPDLEATDQTVWRRAPFANCSLLSRVFCCGIFSLQPRAKQMWPSCSSAGGTQSVQVCDVSLSASAARH